MFGACCLRSWLNLPPAKGAKSAYLRFPCVYVVLPKLKVTSLVPET